MRILKQNTSNKKICVLCVQLFDNPLILTHQSSSGNLIHQDLN